VKHRAFLILFLLLALPVLALLATDWAQSRRAEKLRAVTEARLEKRLDISFDHTPLAAALDDIAKQAGVEIMIDWDALDPHHIAPDSPISARVRGVEADIALIILLDGRAGARAEHWIDDRGRVRITPHRADTVVLEVYDISRLLPRPGGAAARNAFTLPADEVISLITEGVSPAEWKPHPGGFAVCQPFDGKLLILHTPGAPPSDRVLPRRARPGAPPRRVACPVLAAQGRSDGGRNPMTRRLAITHLVLPLALLTVVAIFWLRGRHHADVAAFFTPGGKVQVAARCTRTLALRGEHFTRPAAPAALR
jgi:hypothetical protein